MNAKRVNPPDATPLVRHILAIDDDERTLSLLERVVKMVGDVEFVGTTDPAAAIRLLATSQPDLILLDWHLPKVEGASLLQEIRARLPKEDFTPVVVFTADESTAVRLLALKAGATEFVTKPLNHAEVVLRVNNLLQIRTLQRNLHQQKSRLELQVREQTRELLKSLGETEAMQARLVQQERLGALGSMATGIAHDFNNVLSLIMGHGALLTEKHLSAEQLEHAEAILTAAENGMALIGKLREFSRSPDEPIVLQNIDLLKLAREALEFSQKHWPSDEKRSRIETEIFQKSDHTLIVRGNRMELRDLLSHLLDNAAASMPEGGRVEIELGDDDGCPLVRVKDTGLGMSEEVQERCMEPFFTTKGASSSGLGLAIAYGVARRHRAQINILSEVNCGTCVTVLFPTGEAEVETEDETKHVEFAGPPRTSAFVDGAPAS